MPIRKYANRIKLVPETRVVIYCEDNGKAPFLEWFASLPDRVQDRVLIRVRRLRALGHELRRPECDYLRDGIYELRASTEGVHYRVLYFFHGRIAAVVAHGLVKESQVPDRDIEVALRRKRCFETAPQRHTKKEI